MNKSYLLIICLFAASFTGCIEEELEKEKELDFERTFKQMITEEKNRQLNQFSLIYFNKIKQNIFISEK